MRSGWDLNSDLRGGRRVCYHAMIVAPGNMYNPSFFLHGSRSMIILGILHIVQSLQRYALSNFPLYLFICLGFYVAFHTVQVISRWAVGRTEETSTYSWSRFCTVNCRPTASNYQLSHLRLDQELNPDLRGRRRVLPLCHRGPLTSTCK